MNKLTIEKGNEKYELLVEQYKIIIGSHYQRMFTMQQIIKMYFETTKYSEYSEEVSGIPIIKINDQMIKTKDYMFFQVNKYYSLENDFKMNAKSLILRYLETVLNNNELKETIQTIEYLFESLSYELSENSFINGNFLNMTSKQLCKLLLPSYIENDYKKNEYDLTIEDIIIFQLKLMQYIINQDTKYTDSILCIEIPELTKQILDEIKQLHSHYILIFTNKWNDVEFSSHNYYICENECLDIASEDMLYRVICDNSYRLLTLKEGKEYMEKYLFDQEHEYTRFIKQILISI